MSEPQIGNWIRRRGTKWHLVESVVAGDAITKCGRRMTDAPTAAGLGLQVSEVMPLTRLPKQPQLCKGGCEARDPSENNPPTEDPEMHLLSNWRVSFPAEDDATTSPVDPA